MARIVYQKLPELVSQLGVHVGENREFVVLINELHSEIAQECTCLFPGYKVYKTDDPKIVHVVDDKGRAREHFVEERE